VCFCTDAWHDLVHHDTCEVSMGHDAALSCLLTLSCPMVLLKPGPLEPFNQPAVQVNMHLAM
jgi:hypothetical protein